jgi:GntR family transcriptional repressor for pyruvate dehydrogenase complex
MNPPPSGPLYAVSRERLTERAEAVLREYIVANRLAPGTQLPPEPSLADSLGVSRNVLRQAVASLQGMLRVTQGSGTFVADPANTEVFQRIADWMGPDTLTEKDYLEVRAIWERGVYELVLERATPSDLDRLDEIASMLLETGDPKDIHARHLEFHELMLAVTGNSFLVTMGNILYRFFWEFGYRDGLVRKPPEVRVLEGHRTIVQFLRTGDPGTISQMIDVHLSPHLHADDKGQAGDDAGSHEGLTKAKSHVDDSAGEGPEGP